MSIERRTIVKDVPNNNTIFSAPNQKRNTESFFIDYKSRRIVYFNNNMIKHMPIVKTIFPPLNDTDTPDMMKSNDDVTRISKDDAIYYIKERIENIQSELKDLTSLLLAMIK